MRLVFNPVTGRLDYVIDDPWVLPPVEEEWDVSGGLPVDPDVGDRYIADGTGDGWTDGYIYEWTGSEWEETVPEEGFMVWLLFELVFWVFFSGGWMELGSDSFLKLDQTTPQSVTGGKPIFEEGLELFDTNPLTITQDGTNTVFDIDGGNFVINDPIRHFTDGGDSLTVGTTSIYWGLNGLVTDVTDNFDGSNDQVLIQTGINYNRDKSATIDNYGTDCLDGTASMRFYSSNACTYTKESTDIGVLTAGVIGAVYNEADIDCNSTGATITSISYGFYSDVFFSGKETDGTHNAYNFLFAGLIETEGHSVVSGSITNAFIYADDGTFLVEETDDTYFILDSSSYPWTKRADNAKLTMGEDDDFQTYWNGTDQVLDPYSEGAGGLKIITSDDTYIHTEEITVDLSALVPDFEIKAPVISGLGYSSMPELMPLTYVLGFYDSIGIFDKSEEGECSILFASLDFADNAEIVADLTNGYFKFNWPLVPDTDDTWDLGTSSLLWKNGWFSQDIYVYADTYALKLGASSDMSIYYDGTDGHIKTDLVAASDLKIDCGTDKTIVLEETVWDDIQFATATGKVPSSNYPDFDTFTTNTKEYKFDVDDFIYLEANEMAHWWKEGTTVYPHVHVALNGANASGSSQYAKFTIYFAYADTNEVWTETSDTVEIEIPDGSADLKHFLGSGTGIALTNNLIGTQIKITLKRIAATTGTEYPNHIFVTQTGLHAEGDTIGSRQISTK